MCNALGDLPLVVITDTNFGDDSIERSQLGDIASLRRAEATSEAAVIDAAGDGATGLLVQWAPITAKVLAAIPGLRFVVRYGVGLDNIDLAAATRLGIVVRNVSDYCVDEVASHTVALITSRSRRLGPYEHDVRSGNWRPDGVETPRPFAEEPVGITGFGRIGRRTAQLVSSLGFPVFFWDPYLVDDVLVDGYHRVDTLEELARASEHLSLHVPATETTNGMISTETLKALGPSGHLVNTSRGTLVVEEDLLACLNDGSVGWASLDVLACEPPLKRSAELTAHPRVTVTPHVGYRSTRSPLELRRRAAAIVREELVANGRKGAFIGDRPQDESSSPA